MNSVSGNGAATVQRRCACYYELEANAIYCPGCGREVEQECPVCTYDGHVQERFYLNYLEPLAYWCCNEYVILSACTGCGRWFSPETHRCPDPRCAKRVLPALPEHTGRLSNNQGHSMEWIWPIAWDRKPEQPQHQLEEPQIDVWDAPDAVSGALAAHGHLYVWTGTNLLGLPDSFGYLGGLPTQRRMQPFLWSDAPIGHWLPLGYGGGAVAEVDTVDRMAVVGGTAILATTEGYLMTDLCRLEQSRLLKPGRPVAHTGGAGWWAAWIMEADGPRLYVASPVKEWEALRCYPVTAPEQACPSSSRNMILHEDTAYWLAQDETLWQMNCAEAFQSQGSAGLKRIERNTKGASYLWADTDGAHVVRSVDRGVVVSLTAANGSTSNLTVERAYGGIRLICALQNWIVAIGDEYAYPLNRRQIGNQFQYRLRGRCVSAVLAPTISKEARLLLLYHTTEGARLDVYLPLSGAEDTLWHQKGLTPQALLPVGDSLYIVHQYGVVRLQEKKA